MLSLFNSLSTLRVGQIIQPRTLGIPQIFARHRSQLAPRKVKWVKRQKGTIPIPTGGSTKGTTLAFGEWGIRIKGNGARFSAKQLSTVEELIKRKLKPIKGAKVFLRIFPDVPVCIKVRNNHTLGRISRLTDHVRGTKLEWGRGREHSSSGQPGASSNFSAILSLTTSPVYLPEGWYLKLEVYPLEKSSLAKVSENPSL